LAALASLAGPVFAETAPEAPAPAIQLFGTLDVGASRQQLAGEEARRTLSSGLLSPSVLGLKGEEAMAGGAKLVFHLEGELTLDDGRLGGSGQGLFNRESWLGFAGNFGRTTLGRQSSPLFEQAQRFSPVGSSMVYAPVLRQLFAPRTALGLQGAVGDAFWSNSIRYQSSLEGPWQVTAAANAGEQSPGSTGRNLGGALVYAKDKLALSVAGQRTRNGSQLALAGAPAGFDHQDSLQLAGSYTWGAWQAMALFTALNNDDTAQTRSRVAATGAQVRTSYGRWMLQVSQASTESQTSPEVSHQALTLGWARALSKRTEVYALYMRDQARDQSSGNSVAVGTQLRY
jgi:predicted porin